MSEPITIKNFVDAWSARGSEKSDAHIFWIELLSALGAERPTEMLQFELPIDVDDHQCYIDGWINATRVLIEQKSRGIDLDKAAQQSDGLFLTPFEQALRYADARAYSQRPRWIVVCNFDELRVYDMDRYHQRRDETYEPNVIMIERLTHEYSRLNFLIDPEDENVNPALKISKEAGEIVGTIYRAFGDVDPVALNKLCVRLVFCLYAEDSGIFDPHQFTDYLRRSSNRRQALIELFKVLDTPIEERAETLSEELLAFPYVNGDLFSGAVGDIPTFNKIADHYLLDAGNDQRFNWFGISPTIFGALFESTLNPNTRRSGGMHYTSLENIHRLIDPLFLDDLHDEFQVVRRKRKNKRRALEQFQVKLASLKFLDPACGSGNFLTETYLSLRRLENEVIRELRKLGAQSSILVSIENFYGIEINDFAVAVARTALWIAENQMMQETEMIIHEDINFLPLTSAAHIVEGNALKLDWSEIAPRGVDYVIGNPPFSGARYMTADNKADLLRVFDGWKNAGNLDFVCCWFKKAADFMLGTQTRAAFVATNSICQGESVGTLWSKLFELVHIDFAHRTFKWTSESEDMAAVYCIIVGFSSAPNTRPKIIFDGKKKFVARNINGYLLDAPNYFVESRSTPLCGVPKNYMGSMPNDGGNLIIKANQYEDFVRREPRAQKFIRPLIGAEEFLNGRKRWCLWLVDATEEELKLPLIAERIEAVRRYREASKRATTKKLAATPALFGENRQPTTNYIIVPESSSGARKYIPMSFMSSDVIPSNTVQIVPDADLYHFGVMMSSVHMAWMKTFCGRFELRYIYSAFIVYNNFPWCERSARIEETAQMILDARALYPDRTLASLYDPNLMPSELRAAHVANDRAVMDAYGFDHSMSESEMVSALMSRYDALTKNF